MSIPDYQRIMLPLLRCLGDQKERRNSELVDLLADELGLSEVEREEVLPSGRETAFANRVRWARFYLLKAGLLESKRRGFANIRAAGMELLDTEPTELDQKALYQYPAFVEFMETPARPRIKGEAETEAEVIHRETPEEALYQSFDMIRQGLAEELLVQIKSASPEFFERLVVQLLVRMGYGGTVEDAGAVLGRTGDGGVDGVIKQDRLGLDALYIQAKRWQNAPVGRPELRNFVGALQERGATKGVFITTSAFAKNAAGYVDRLGNIRVVLIDGERLAELMIAHGVGVSPVATYELKRVDSDYFTET